MEIVTIWSHAYGLIYDWFEKLKKEPQLCENKGPPQKEATAEALWNTQLNLFDFKLIRLFC